MSTKHICPVCKFDGLKEAPFSKNNEASREICPCCGFEFGFDGGNDPEVFKKYHQQWVKNGSKWFIPKVLLVFLLLNTFGFAQDEKYQPNVDYKVDKMKTELNLSESQAIAIKPIIKDYLIKRRVILEEVEGQGIVDHVAVKGSLKALKEDERRKLGKILSEDQMNKWINKENLRAALNPDGEESTVNDDPEMNMNGADFKF